MTKQLFPKGTNMIFYGFLRFSESLGASLELWQKVSKMKIVLIYNHSNLS
jgi:hypothetical protein